MSTLSYTSSQYCSSQLAIQNNSVISLGFRNFIINKISGDNLTRPNYSTYIHSMIDINVFGDGKNQLAIAYSYKATYDF